MNPSKHILVAILVPLIAISAAASYYRFIVAGNYIVEYEGTCDPATESCFEGCEDDACEITYPYKFMQKYAADLRNTCGPDITDCEEASICLTSDRDCVITYCVQADLGEDEMCVIAESEAVTDEDLGAAEEAGQEENAETE